MENQLQNEGDPAESARGYSNGSEPQIVSAYPDYDAWYPDQDKYEAEETRFWRRQNMLATLSIIVSALTLAAAVAAACVAFNAFKETKRQADAAEAQIGIARETEVRQLRPYLYVGHSALLSYGPRKFGAEIQLHHSGQMPAYKVRMDATVVVAQYRLVDPNLGDITEMSGIDHYEYSALQGPEPARETVSTTFEPQVIEMVMRTDPGHGLEQRFYLFGIVRYLDIFGKTSTPTDFVSCFTRSGIATAAKLAAKSTTSPDRVAKNVTQAKGLQLRRARQSPNIRVEETRIESLQAELAKPKAARTPKAELPATSLIARLRAATPTT